MMPTKEQERKALEQIKKILAGLGNNPETSYICRALDGCIDIAEENIENDFADSWRGRWESSEKKLHDATKDREYFRQEAERQAAFTEKTESEKAELQKQLNEARQHAEELRGKSVEYWNMYRTEEDEKDALKDEVIKLKAKLYDLIVGEGA